MKNKRKILSMSFAIVAMCFGLIVGSTYALFTNESSLNIAVTSGKVDVKAIPSELKLYSRDIEQEDNFELGGSATMEGNIITIARMAPMDAVKFDINIENFSNISVKYRVVIKCIEDTGLLEALTVTFTEGEDIQEFKEGYSYSDWADLAPLESNAVTGEHIKTIKTSIAFLDRGEQNKYQEKSCSLAVVVEAVQGNANIGEAKQKWNEDGKLKILNIGNSFSDDSMEYVYDIATDVGVEDVEIGKLYIASSKLSQHLGNAKNNTAAYTYYYTNDGNWNATYNYTIAEAIASTNWDYIIFLQLSTDSDKSETYDDLKELIDIVQPLAPKAKMVWNMTWSLRSDYANLQYTHSTNQINMYENIVNAVQTKVITNENIDIVIPVGTAIQNARSSYIEEKRINRDAKHLTNSYGTNCGLGSYIAGLTVVESLTGISTKNVNFVPHDIVNGEIISRIDDLEKLLAKESSYNAIKNPYQVTQSIYLNNY